MGNGESSYHRFLNGDKSAFSEIIDLYRKNLIFFINRYLNNLSLSEEIAEDCGYGDKSGLYRAFDKFYGCTPTEYRQNAGNK